MVCAKRCQGRRWEKASGGGGGGGGVCVAQRSAVWEAAASGCNPGVNHTRARTTTSSTATTAARTLLLTHSLTPFLLHSGFSPFPYLLALPRFTLPLLPINPWVYLPLLLAPTQKPLPLFWFSLLGSSRSAFLVFFGCATVWHTQPTQLISTTLGCGHNFNCPLHSLLQKSFGRSRGTCSARKVILVWVDTKGTQTSKALVVEDTEHF